MGSIVEIADGAKQKSNWKIADRVVVTTKENIAEVLREEKVVLTVN